MSLPVSSVLKSLFVLAVCALPALADTKFTPPITIDASSEIVVSLVNPGAASVTYSIVFYDAVTGESLVTRQGTLAGLRGVTAALNQATARDAIVAIVSISGNRAQLTSFTVRDRITKVPRYTGTPADGTGI